MGTFSSNVKIKFPSLLVPLTKVTIRSFIQRLVWNVLQIVEERFGLLTLFQSEILSWILQKVNLSVFCMLGWFENDCKPVTGDFTLGSWPFACKGDLLFVWLMGTSANAGLLGCVYRAESITCWDGRCSMENGGLKMFHYFEFQHILP